MFLPEYVTVDEVKRVCVELGIRDWTALEAPEVTREEAEIVLGVVGTGGMEIEPDEFRKGLEVELEHGVMFKNANVTNNHPVLTGKIVLAHFKESLDYYRLLEVAELEGDLVKAVAAGDAAKLLAKYRKLLEARRRLDEAAAARVGG